jgi:Cu+-exporting ATPase
MVSGHLGHRRGQLVLLLNGSGALIMKAEKVGADMLLSRIVQMVAEAQRSRAPIQKLADVVAAEYSVQIVVAVAVVMFIIQEWLGPDPKMATALINAVAVLIIACPCALGLATPMSSTVAQQARELLQEFSSKTRKR